MTKSLVLICCSIQDVLINKGTIKSIDTIALVHRKCGLAVRRATVCLRSQADLVNIFQHAGIHSCTVLQSESARLPKPLKA